MIILKSPQKIGDLVIVMILLCLSTKVNILVNFWSTSSQVLLSVTAGITVDYATHVGHSFLVQVFFFVQVQSAKTQKKFVFLFHRKFLGRRQQNNPGLNLPRKALHVDPDPA